MNSFPNPVFIGSTFMGFIYASCISTVLVNAQNLNMLDNFYFGIVLVGILIFMALDWWARQLVLSRVLYKSGRQLTALFDAKVIVKSLADVLVLSFLAFSALSFTKFLGNLDDGNNKVKYMSYFFNYVICYIIVSIVWNWLSIYFEKTITGEDNSPELEINFRILKNYIIKGDMHDSWAKRFPQTNEVAVEFKNIQSQYDEKNEPHGESKKNYFKNAMNIVAEVQEKEKKFLKEYRKQIFLCWLQHMLLFQIVVGYLLLIISLCFSVFSYNYNSVIKSHLLLQADNFIYYMALILTTLVLVIASFFSVKADFVILKAGFEDNKKKYSGVKILARSKGMILLLLSLLVYLTSTASILASIFLGMQVFANFFMVNQFRVKI